MTKIQKVLLIWVLLGLPAALLVPSFIQDRQFNLLVPVRSAVSWDNYILCEFPLSPDRQYSARIQKDMNDFFVSEELRGYLLELLGTSHIPDYYLHFGQGASHERESTDVFIEFAFSDRMFSEEIIAALFNRVIDHFNSQNQDGFLIDGSVMDIEIEHPSYSFPWQNLLRKFGLSMILYLLTLITLTIRLRKWSLCKFLLLLTGLEFFLFFIAASFFIEDRLFDPVYYSYEEGNKYFRIEQKLIVDKPGGTTLAPAYRWDSYPETLAFLEDLEQPVEEKKQNFIWWLYRTSSFDSQKGIYSVLFDMKMFNLQGTYKDIPASGTTFYVKPVVHKRRFYKYLSDDQRQWMDRYFDDSIELYTSWLKDYGIDAERSGEPVFIGAYPHRPWADSYVQVFVIVYLVMNCFLLICWKGKGPRLD